MFFIVFLNGNSQAYDCSLYWYAILPMHHVNTYLQGISAQTVTSKLALREREGHIFLIFYGLFKKTYAHSGFQKKKWEIMKITKNC